jgi:LysM repeat protein
LNIRSLRPLSRDVPRSPATGRAPLVLPSPLLLLLALLVLLDAALTPRLAPPPAAIWRQKPLLGYFILTQSLAAEIERQGLLTQPQLRLARRVALLQGSELRRLQAESLPVVLDPALTLQQKRQLIREMGYNRRVAAISAASQQLLSLLLPASDYARFTAWAENRWRLERQLHGMASFAAAPLILRTQSLAPGPQIVTPLSALPAARSYKIFATRYDSGDRYAVALPDKCLKFSNAGNRLCVDDGYQINQGYFVYLSYDGETAAEVWESGPWNVDDNYWSTSRDPQPRRMFADLPAGMPEAQAAFFDGYNGGADQFGRTVIAPFGIDLGRKVSIDIGLQPGNNDWINITFAWTEGWDKVKKPGQGSPSQPAGQGASSTAAPTTPPLLTATPNPDGSVVHEVQPGQALWSIAIAYGVTLQDLYSLNGLSEGAVIRPGDKLVIIAAQPTPTPTQTLTPTGTLPPTPTRRPTSTHQPATLTPTVTWTPAPGSALPASTSRLDPLLLFIAGGAVVGGILLLVGVLLRRR